MPEDVISRRRAIVTICVLATLLVGVAACSGDGAAGDVQFGEGEIPSTIPDDFPVPPEAVIGASLVDPNRDYTELIYRVRAEIEDVVAYYDANLVARGWDIVRSEQSGDTYEIEFARSDEPAGELGISIASPGVIQVIVTLGGN